MKRALLLLALVLSAAAAAEPLKLSVQLNAGTNLLFARTRTMGGLGGGVMARGTLDGGWFVDAGLDYGAILGNVGTLHVGGGWQRAGLWALSVSAHAGLMFGDRLAFYDPALPLPSDGPALSATLSVAPLKFCAEKERCVSVLELGGGWGTDFATSGPALRVRFLEVSVGF